MKAIIFLISMTLLVNAALIGWMKNREEQLLADAARYQEQIEQAERIRDLAVQELEEMSFRQAEEQETSAAMEGYIYIGECTITAYCCEPYKHICGTGDGLTATGLPVAPGMVAVDPDVIPLGSTVIIEGAEYLAADTGVTGLWVDVAVPTHAEALELGVRTAEVWVAEERMGES